MAHLEPTLWDFSSGALPYRDQLYKTALRMTRSVEETEDLLQETYLKAFKYYDRFEEGTNLKAWLFRIMKNTFINGYRKRRSQPQQVEFDDLRESVEVGVGVVSWGELSVSLTGSPSMDLCSWQSGAKTK